jgi:hypothetical protein
MFNRTYQIRRRRTKLQGEQLDITFPRRGRPTKFRRLERAGQMRLGLTPGRETKCGDHGTKVAIPESIDSALDYLFPVRPMTDDELSAEFHRLFD